MSDNTTGIIVFVLTIVCFVLFSNNDKGIDLVDAMISNIECNKCDEK
jgi:hypothetical protein